MTALISWRLQTWHGTDATLQAFVYLKKITHYLDYGKKKSHLVPEACLVPVETKSDASLPPPPTFSCCRLFAGMGGMELSLGTAAGPLPVDQSPLQSTPRLLLPGMVKGALLKAQVK